MGAPAQKQFAVLHSCSQVEQSTIGHADATGRGNADDVSLDAVLISKDPELVLGHLKARRMGEDSMDAVHRIGGTCPILVTSRVPSSTTSARSFPAITDLRCNYHT